MAVGAKRAEEREIHVCVYDKWGETELEPADGRALIEFMKEVMGIRIKNAREHSDLSRYTIVQGLYGCRRYTCYFLSESCLSAC